VSGILAVMMTAIGLFGVIAYMAAVRDWGERSGDHDSGGNWTGCHCPHGMLFAGAKSHER
jgi:hypothetical protein